MEKIRYETDPFNRLVIDRTGRKGDLKKFRKVIDGRFKLDKNNSLSYHVKSPVFRKEHIPNQLRLKGNWSLTEDHDLRLTFDKSARKTFGDKLTLKGQILDVNKNSLLFAVTTKTKTNTRMTYTLKLSGAWTADKNNRLSFRVKREKGRTDVLTLGGAWEIDRNYQVVYKYEKASLLTKKKKLHTLTFRGYWDITDKARISYMLSGRTDSSFSFKTSAGLFRENRIKYELGIGIDGRVRPLKRTVTLFGKWRLKKDLGLVFEVRQRDKKAYTIVFGADLKLKDKDRIAFTLKNHTENKDTGIELELSRKILKGDGEAFIRLLASGREAAVYAGAAWRW